MDRVAKEIREDAHNSGDDSGREVFEAMVAGSYGPKSRCEYYSGLTKPDAREIA